MLKILHTSDNHIDFYATRLGVLKVSGNKNPIHEYRIKLTTDIIHRGLAHNCSVLCITGDLHNRGKPPPQEYSDLNKIFDEVPDNIPVFIIGGNHDELTPRGSPLQPLIGRRKNVHVSLNLCAYEHHGIVYIQAPWGTRYEDLKNLCQKYKTAPKVLLYHVGVIGSEFHWGEVEGEQGTVSTQQIAELGCIATLLGHYHGYVTFKDCEAAYASCPEYLSFGEEHQQKGFLIWDLEAKTVDLHPTNPSPFITLTPEQFISNDKDDFDKAYVRIKGDVDEQMRSQIVNKMRVFNCLGVKPELQSIASDRKLYALKGNSNMEILRNFLTVKGLTQDIDSCITLDQEIEKSL